jgi:hypothetical protein
MFYQVLLQHVTFTYLDMSDSDILEDEPGPAPVLDRASVERTSGRRG